MKSKKMKQGMSWLLCMVMLLSNNVTVLADETDSSGEGQTQDVSAEETEASTEEAGVTTELETEETVETTEQTEPVEEEQPVYNEAVQLRHEFKDENGNVISVVTADIQEGSFEADASAISMEVDTLTEEEDSYMQGLIRENLPEYTYLGDYVLYDVVFKVNGELTDPMKEIKLTYEGTGIDVQDIQDAVVCQYNVADPEVTDDKDSVTEIIQRDDMIRYMEENGEDTSKVDDHDLSEVVLNENGAADQISMEVRKSSIFGCYVEELSQETAFSQEVNGTTITVTAPEGAFPMDADQVSMAAAPLSEEQAAAVEEQLSAQAESQGQELKGYAAYDISLWANGEEIQPQKPVTVTMENTGLDVAETLTAFQVSDEDNSVSNIGSIDENGTVSMETAAVLPAGTAAFGEPEVQDEETVTGDTEQTTDETGETADSDKQDEISGEDENKEDTAEEEDKKTEEENIREENIKDEEKDSNQTDAENEEDAEKETAETGNEKENIEKEETKNNSEEAVTTDENTDDEENNEKEAETIVSEPVTLTEEKGGVTVILTAPEGAFPVDSNQVSMTVEELTEEQKAIIEEQLQAQADENGQELKGYVAYDITLWANGEIIQPQVPVTVTFENAELDVENAEVTEGFQLDEETETLNNIEGSVEEDGSAVVEAEHFTPTGVGSFGAPEEMEANNNTPALQVEAETTKAKTDEFIFQKVTQDGTPLPGAEFTLYAETDTEFSNPLATATSDDEGKVIFKEDLQPGTYIMKETKVPEKYVQADTIWKYIVKDNGTVELRDESGNIISPTAGNEYPQIQNYNIEGHLKTYKTAEVLNWDNRTYKIELYASHDLSVEWPKDIVLALDVSGSMAWTLSPPSSETRKISRIDIDEEGNNAQSDQKLIGQPATVSYYKQFHYYAKDGADYKPIVYRPVSDTNNHPENAGWYYVGASRGQTVGYDGKIADQEDTIVYVLDGGDQRSVQTKLEALQEAVTAFVENVKNISPESQIGIVTFSEILQASISLTNAETLSGNINDIFNNKIKLRGGTKQNLGLDAAYSMLDESSQNQNKAVVLFTDGAPNGVSVEEITSSADHVKEIADLFTVGLYDSETAAEQTANMQRWASQPSDKYCFITSDTESLMKEFADLFASMNIAVTGATMRDYIDSRFVVTNSDGQVLETGAEIGDGGVLGYDSESGLQYVEWTNQTISYSEDGKTAWNQTIFIKAKPEYIGGNDVTTNAGSGYSVTVNGVTENKESPIVNVKIDFKIGNAEDTIFFGENLQNYFTESKQKTVTDIQPTTGVNEYTIWKDVKEPQIQWFRDSACTQPITVQEIMGSAPQDETVYYAKVTVAPISNGDSGLSNTKGNSNNISGVSKTGTYTVHVVSGSIVIEKTIDKLPNKIPDSGLSFSFTVTNTSTSPETPCLVTIHFTKEELENGTLRKSFAVLDKLPQGIYTVKEDSNELYTAGEMTFSGVESNPAVIKNNSIYIGVMDNGEADPEKGTHLNRRDSLVIVENSLVDNLDTPYMRVQKTFVGLDKDSLPQNFEINLYSDEAYQNLVAVLTLDGKDGTIKPTSTSKDGLTFVWKLDNLEAGIYYLKESGQKDGYNHSIKVNNQEYTEQSVIEVSTQDAEYTFEKEQRISPCSATNSLEIQDPDYIVGGMDSKEVYFVWTKDTLSVGERNAIIQHIQTTFGTDFPKIKADTTAFFSTQERIETGLNYRGTIKLEKSGENTNLIFSAPSQWEQVVYGRYTKSDKVNAEIEVVNTYTQAVIDLQKYGSDYEMGQLPGAKFSLYQGTKDDESIIWSENPMENYSAIDVTADNTRELKLKDGYYKLVETTAPGGYVLLEDSIYFKVEDQKVVLIDENDKKLSNNKADMWEVDETGLVIKIKNEARYDLPSAGGSGIFLYMIGGTLLLIAGSLMIYINRRREVLRK